MGKIAATIPAVTGAAKSNTLFFEKKGSSFLSATANKISFFQEQHIHPWVQTKLNVGQLGNKNSRDSDTAPNSRDQKSNNQEFNLASTNTSNEPLLQAKCTECEKEEKLHRRFDESSISSETNIQQDTNHKIAQTYNPLTTVFTAGNNHSALQRSSSLFDHLENKVENKEEEKRNEFQELPIQAKLTVGSPNDPLEKEADHVADQVVQKLAIKETLQSKAESELQTKAPILQTLTHAGKDESVPGKEDEKNEELPNDIRKKSVGSDLPEPPPEEQDKSIHNGNVLRACDAALHSNLHPLKPAIEGVANQKQGTLQRWCRECEEGDQVLLKYVDSLQLASDTAGATDGSRESVLAAAKTMLGKIEAKHNDGSGNRVGFEHLLEIFHLAAPGVWNDSIIQTAGAQMPSWCGIFAVWAHKKAGKNIGNWEMGKGVSAFGTLKQTSDPLPGDIGYIDKPYQHHCIVVKVEGDTISSIDGNSGLFSEVKENSKSRSKYSGFFTAFSSSGIVQRKEETDSIVPSTVEDRLSSTKGSGSTMTEPVRQSMESSIGADFSNVKIHTDSNAVQLSKDLNAQAFTHGSDIYFNDGKYNPTTTGGQHLLAHELTHTVQQGAAGLPTGRELAQTKIQRVPVPAGSLYPTTPKQVFYDSYKDEVIDIQGKSIFDPGEGLGNYISSYWETGTREVAVNIKFGNLAEGYIFVQQSGTYTYRSCIGDVFGIAKLCTDVAPNTYNYRSNLHVLPMKHKGFKDSQKGALVLTVQISGGILYCKLGWVAGKSYDAIDPVMDAANVRTDEAAFLPLIYGADYDGENYTSQLFNNTWLKGSLYFNSLGELALANQKKLGGLFVIQDDRYQFIASLMAQPIGLEKFDIPIKRDNEGILIGESIDLKLDANWTNGKNNGEDGQYSLVGTLRATYENGQFDIFGKAAYNSARINGEVNISISSESKARQLFLEHAPGTRTAGGDQPTVEENTKESLALTAWGSLNFKLIDEKGAASPGGPPAKKGPISALEGKASFVVSPEGYIILAGRVKFPTKWLLTEPLDYSSKDIKDESKHLFEKKDIELGGIWVPELLSKINFTLGIEIDANAHLDPLELYEVEVGGVYSNHPSYRSEVDIIPHLYIKGNAGATLIIILDGCLDALGVIPVAGAGASLTGKASVAAFIDAAPTVRKIWEGGDKPASYALEGIIHTGGKVDFALSGGFHLTMLKQKIAKSKDYHIGSWTLGEFGAIVKLHEFILGSGTKPAFDFSKMGLTDTQRKKLGTDIIKEKESHLDPKKDKPTGGFEETDKDGKTVEKGTAFSDTPILHNDHDADVLDNKLEESFLMLETLHELILNISGTRNAPNAQIEMASGKKEPLKDKIEREEIKLDDSWDIFSDDVDIEKKHAQEADLAGIKAEAAKIEIDAANTAQKPIPGEDPKQIGFEQLENHISQYGKKYKASNLGDAPDTTPKAPPTPSAPLSPISISPGETLTIPYKGGIARAKYLGEKPGFVGLEIKSKSASGDITNWMDRAVFVQWLADGKVIRWTQERERLMKNRPPYRDGLVEEVWDNAVKASPDGIVRDPNIKKVLTWDRKLNRFDQWHMGHIKGAKYSDLVDTYVDGKISYDDFIKEYNNVKNYRPEDPVENMKHEWE